MNKRELFDWLKSEGCEINLKPGFSDHLISLSVDNERLKKSSFCVLMTFDDKVPETAIVKLIKELVIAPPKSF